VRTLYVDLASRQSLFVAVDEEAVRASVLVTPGTQDERLLQVVEQVVIEAGWTLETLTGIACVVGPGGFTSLRVAVSLCNALAWGRQIPLLPLHLSEVYAARWPQADGVWLHTTQRASLFCRGWGSQARRWPEARLVSLDDLRTHLVPGLRWCGELVDDHRVIIEGLGVKPASLVPLADALPSLLSRTPGVLPPIDAWYGRDGL
jgi:tRNA threonylcarbamoyl adenosine modification protein YeaZ